MKIISNPPFKLTRKFVSVLNRADEYVVLHTFRFCNNILRRYELIMPEEWEEITAATPIAISSSKMKENHEERPDFYIMKIASLDDVDNPDKFYHLSNTHFSDINCSSYKQLNLKNVNDDSFIAKAGGVNIFKGQRKKYILVVPKKDYSKHLDQIFIDSYKWKDTINRAPLIRRIFCE